VRANSHGRRTLSCLTARRGKAHVSVHSRDGASMSFSAAVAVACTSVRFVDDPHVLSSPAACKRSPALPAACGRPVARHRAKRVDRPDRPPPARARLSRAGQDESGGRPVATPMPWRVASAALVSSDRPR
jgi:hypothetical protein